MTPDAPSSIVVVGASLAGLRAAEELRRLGFTGTLTLVGAEPHLPYDRPPLSKDFLAGTTDADALGLRRQPYDELDLDLRLGVRATGLDPAARIVSTDAGDLPYDGLVVATGATARRLPDQPDLPGIHVLRTLDDATALRADLASASRVVVVGAGFIGAEAAATCRTRGLDVTVLEALPSPMVRGVGPLIGDTLAGLHRDRGVDLRTSVGVAGFEGTGRVERVRLADGSALDADVVLVGVGAVPVTDWLGDSGLTIDNGVVCDATLLAGPGVVAAGDVARWPNPAAGGDLVRLEHWTNASEQGVAAAARLLAADDAAVPFSSVPFVWSDQYDVKIQVVGHVSGDDTVEIVDGSLDERKFVAIFGRGDRLTGAVAFSRPRVLMQYRRLLVDGATFADALEFSKQ
ncbi:MAG: FAD-dependent oxidoreductase [Actinobacteria bacterium]|nr:FAD-dependent oxidoreductase [Actinomycetota bacterium]